MLIEEDSYDKLSKQMSFYNEWKSASSMHWVGRTRIDIDTIRRRYEVYYRYDMISKFRDKKYKDRISHYKDYQDCIHDYDYIGQDNSR